MSTCSFSHTACFVSLHELIEVCSHFAYSAVHLFMLDSEVTCCILLSSFKVRLLQIDLLRLVGTLAFVYTYTK